MGLEIFASSAAVKNGDESKQLSPGTVQVTLSIGSQFKITAQFRVINLDLFNSIIDVRLRTKRFRAGECLINTTLRVAREKRSFQNCLTWPHSRKLLSRRGRVCAVAQQASYLPCDPLIPSFDSVSAVNHKLVAGPNPALRTLPVRAHSKVVKSSGCGQYSREEELFAQSADEVWVFLARTQVCAGRTWFAGVSSGRRRFRLAARSGRKGLPKRW